jgi:hypothetical protein
MIRESEFFHSLLVLVVLARWQWQPFESLKGCCGMYGCILYMYVPNVY